MATATSLVHGQSDYEFLLSIDALTSQVPMLSECVCHSPIATPRSYYQ